MYICILNYIDSKHQPWRVSVTDMGWLIHRSIFQGWKVWVQPIGTMNPSVVLIGTSRKLLLGFNRDYQNHEDIGPHVCWDSPTLRIEFQLWTLDFKKNDMSWCIPWFSPSDSNNKLPGTPGPSRPSRGPWGPPTRRWNRRNAWKPRGKAHFLSMDQQPESPTAETPWIAMDRYEQRHQNAGFVRLSR